MRRSRRHPRGSVIAYVWIGVLMVAFLAALFSQDEDPNTDEGAGFGALSFVVGLALTVAYLAVAKRLNARTTAKAGPGAANVSTEPDTRTWVRRNLGPLAAGAAAIVVVVVVGSLAPSPDAVTPATQPAHVLGKDGLIATIKAAASAASRNQRITSVACANPVAIGDNLLLTCAVTFQGPACQLWLAGGIEDTEPAPLGDPTDGRSGRADANSARCD